MRKIDIVRKAIAHQKTDVIPYIINFAPDAIEKYGQDLKKRYLDNKLIKAVDDGILSFPEAIEIGIGNFVFHMRDIPWWEFTGISEQYKNSHEPLNYIPKTKARGNYEHYETRLKYIKDNFDLYLLVINYGSNYEKIRSIREESNYLIDMCIHKDYLKMVFDFVTSKDVSFMRDLISYDEVDGVMYGSDWGAQKSLLMSPETFRELIMPGEKARYDAAKEFGKDAWVHSCGAIQSIIPLLIELGLDVLNPLQSEVMDIYEIKQKYGDDLTFWGGLSTQNTLPYSSVDEIKEITKNMIEAMSINGGYITASSQHIQADVPLENIIAFIDAAKEYRSP